MVFSSLDLNQQFKQAFNNTLTESDLRLLAKKIQILTPNPGEPFWESKSCLPGIYLILEGKVRLLDEQDNLVASLSEGIMLGQISLFPWEKLQPHAARASWGAKLGYLSLADLGRYLLPESELSQQLHHQALAWDLLLLCHHHSANNRQKIQDLLAALPQLERHQLATGELPTKILQRHLLILRQGTIIHSSGLKLTAGQPYNGAALPQNGAWLINQPVELFTLASKPQASRPATRSSEIVPVSTLQIQPRAQSRKVVAQRTIKQKLYFPSPQVKLGQWWQQLTKRYPFRRQHSGSDCGVACLVMIGQYWGKNFSITELRSIANVNRSGASIKGLIFAAEHLGFASPSRKSGLAYLSQTKTASDRSLARKSLYRRLSHYPRSGSSFRPQDWSSHPNPSGIYSGMEWLHLITHPHS